MSTSGRIRRAVVAAALAGAAVASLGAVGGAAAAGPNVYVQPTSIAIPDLGYGNPLPSNIVVSGEKGVITKLTFGVGFTSNHPQDVDLLLVGPNGKAIAPISDAGGNATGVAGLDMNFADDASAQASQAGPLTSGTFKPSDFEPGEPMGMGAPDPPYSPTFASAFNGISPNGTWKLYSFSDFFNGNGSSSMGAWSIGVTTAVPDLTITANKQKLKGKVKLTVSSPVAGKVVLAGGVKSTTLDLAADTPTLVKAKIKPKLRNRLADKIDESGKAKLKVKGTITDSVGDVDTAKAKVKLKG